MRLCATRLQGGVAQTDTTGFTLKKKTTGPM